MSALLRQIALVSRSTKIKREDVSKVSAALQKQACRDLGPTWKISATVDAFDSLNDVPPGYWPIIVMDDIDQPGAAGIHQDENGRPIALVSASDSLDVWSVTASHEALEMLVDPSGNRLVSGDSPDAAQGRVDFLVEVADPSESSDYAYSCNGILVSDFCTPNFFDPTAAPGVRYSFTGAIKAPRQILPGGYLSWQDPVTNAWWQASWFGGSEAVFAEIGPIDISESGNARAAIDRRTMRHTRQAIARGRAYAAQAGRAPEVVARSSSARADMWRRRVGEILSRASASAETAPRPSARPATTRVGAPGPAPAYDAQQATLLGQFIEAAYAMHDDDPSALMPKPSANFPSGYRLVASILMEDFIVGSTGPVFYGFVAQSRTDPSKYVLAFRGTSNGVEWWDDLNALKLTPFGVPGCGSVGAGFARIYDTIQLVEYPSAAPIAAPAATSLAAHGSLARQMAALVGRRPAPMDREAFPAMAAVAVAGHSLGGALVTLYALENGKLGELHNPIVCTFASPRVGDSDFVSAFDKLEFKSWRFANDPDVVPLLPPEILGFRHVDTLCRLNSTGKVRPSVGCWHALETYLSLINPQLQPTADCRLAPLAAAGAAARLLPAALKEQAPDGSTELAAAMTVVCPRVNRAIWVGPLLAAFARFGLSTDRRRAAAMGQFLVEAGGAFQAIVENADYSAQSASEEFPDLFPMPEDAASYVGDPVKFGNHVCANQLGNGDEASGDGYRFRRRGLIPLAGRSEYAAFGAAMGQSAEEAAQ